MEVIIHGRPCGQAIWTKDNNDDDFKYAIRYLENKYGNDVSSLIVIDFVGDKRYYTYLRRKDFYEKDRQRPGSYFAITIVLQDMICKVSELYEIFNEVYNAIINSGQVIKEYRNGDKPVTYYIIDKFDSIDWNEIVDWLKPKIDNCTQSYSENVRDTTEFTQPVLLSLKDVDSPYFLSLLPHKLLISPDYPCLAEKAKQAVEANDKIKELNDIIKSKDEQIAELTEKNSSGQRKKSHYEEKYKKLKAENDNLKDELTTSKQCVENLNEQKADFKAQCDRYFATAEDIPDEEQPPKPNNKYKSFIKDNFLMVLLLFMQILTFIVLLRKSPDIETKNVCKENDTTEVKEDTVVTVDVSKGSVSNEVEKATENNKGVIGEDTGPKQSNEYRIDLADFNGTRDTGKTYSLSLINKTNSTNVIINCEYEVVSGDAKINNNTLIFNKTDGEVKIKAIFNGKKSYVIRVFK